LGLGKLLHVTYREGDWSRCHCAGGFAVSLIARANPRGVLLGYFFGPPHAQIPKLQEVSGLKPADAVLVSQFGHLGIRDSTWPILGRLDGWDRRDWATPMFIRYEELTGRSHWVFYDDDDPTGCCARNRQLSALPSKGEGEPDGPRLRRGSPDQAPGLTRRSCQSPHPADQRQSASRPSAEHRDRAW